VAGKLRLWGFDDGERQLLFEVTANIPALRTVLDRARPHAEISGLWIVQATARELDEMYSLVEALMDGTRRRRELDLLEGLRASLCTSIDGF
jgi:hypothetical protein